MTAKKYLRQIKYAEDHINNLISEKEQLACLAECVGAIPTSDKVISSPRPDKMENAVIKMVEVEKEIDRCIDGYVDLRRRIIKQIENVGDERFYCVLYKRYVEQKDFKDIAEEINYSYDYVKKIHLMALDKFSECILKDSTEWHSITPSNVL